MARHEASGFDAFRKMRHAVPASSSGCLPSRRRLIVLDRSHGREGHGHFDKEFLS